MNSTSLSTCFRCPVSLNEISEIKSKKGATEEVLSQLKKKVFILKVQPHSELNDDDKIQLADVRKWILIVILMHIFFLITGGCGTGEDIKAIIGLMWPDKSTKHGTKPGNHLFLCNFIWKVLHPKTTRSKVHVSDFPLPDFIVDSKVGALLGLESRTKTSFALGTLINLGTAHDAECADDAEFAPADVNLILWLEALNEKGKNRTASVDPQKMQKCARLSFSYIFLGPLSRRYYDLKKQARSISARPRNLQQASSRSTTSIVQH